jgi:hypothetical protein
MRCRLLHPTACSLDHAEGKQDWIEGGLPVETGQRAAEAA